LCKTLDSPEGKGVDNIPITSPRSQKTPINKGYFRVNVRS
jgi:hypothetical protein